MRIFINFQITLLSYEAYTLVYIEIEIIDSIWGGKREEETSRVIQTRHGTYMLDFREH